MEFTVNDRVKYTGTYFDELIGCEGTITSMCPNYPAPYSVLFDGETESRKCYGESLEKA